LLSNTPRAAVFSKAGFGAYNITAMQYTGALDLLFACLHTTDDYCRLTTIETLQEIKQQKKIDIMDPPHNIESSRLAQYPPFYRSAGAGLKLASLSIKRNPNMPLHEVMIHNSLYKVRTPDHIIRSLHEHCIWTLRDLLPSLTEGSETKACLLEEILIDITPTDYPELKRLLTHDIDTTTQHILTPPQQHSLVLVCASAIRNTTAGRTTLPYTPASRRDPIILDEPHISSSHELASDGSYDEVSNTAGIGVGTLTHEISGQIPGKQSINRAEAFALAIKIAPHDRSSTIYCDSQSTVTAVKSMLLDNTFKQRTKATNDSIIKHITTSLTSKPNVQIEWIRAHTGQEETPHILNDKADRAAKLGRTGTSTGVRITVTECYAQLPEFYPQVIYSPEIIEGNYHAVFYNRIDNTIFHNSIRRSNLLELHNKPYCKHVRNFAHPMRWAEACEANFKGKCDDADFLTLFKHKLCSASLPTPYIKGILNSRTFPGLYDTTSCEICHTHGKPDEYHYLCKCTDVGVELARLKVCTDVIGRLQEFTKDTMNVQRMYELMFPANRDIFTHGLVHTQLKAYLSSLDMTTQAYKSVQSHIQVWWTAAMHEVWVGACASLTEMGLDYHTRMAHYTETPNEAEV
jgi:ribonuclease HI